MSYWKLWWEGRALLEIEKKQISEKCEWAYRSSKSWENLQILNKAFRIFYDCRRNIEKCPDFDQGEAMLKELEDAATTGWKWHYFGVHDLKQAIKHFETSGQLWTNEDTGQYEGGEGKLYAYDSDDAPFAAVEFLKAMEERLRKFMRILEEIGAESKTLQAAIHGAQSDWEAVKGALKKVESAAKRAQKFLWLAPASVEEKIKKPLGTTVTYVEKLNKYISRVERFIQLLNAVRTGSGQDILMIALEEALGQIPILGEFYIQALKLIPKMEREAPLFFKWYTDRIDWRGSDIDARKAQMQALH
jgi:hypothetical protein